MKPWSWLYSRCRNCGGTGSKHRSGGLCQLCYKAKDRSKRYKLHGPISDHCDDWPDNPEPLAFEVGARVLHLGRYEAIVRGSDAKGLVVCVIDGRVWHVPPQELTA